MNCCRSCFKFDYDLTVEPSQSSKSVQKLENDEIRYVTEGIRLTGHRSTYRKNDKEDDTAIAAYDHGDDNQSVASSQGNAGDYNFGVVPDISVNPPVVAGNNVGDGVTGATILAVSDVPKSDGVQAANGTVNANGVIITQPRSDGTPPGSQQFVVPDTSADEKEPEAQSHGDPSEAKDNLSSDTSSGIPKVAIIKAGAEEDVEISSEPIKLNDEGLDIDNEASQSDVADNLDVPSDLVVEGDVKLSEDNLPSDTSSGIPKVAIIKAGAEGDVPLPSEPSKLNDECLDNEASQSHVAEELNVPSEPVAEGDEAKDNLPSDTSSGIPKVAVIKAGAEGAVELSSEPIKINDKSLDNKTSQSDVAEDLDVPSEPVAESVEAEDNLPIDTSSGIPKVAIITAGAEGDVEVPSEPIKLSDEVLDMPASQTDVVDDLDVPSEHDAEGVEAEDNLSSDTSSGIPKIAIIKAGAEGNVEITNEPIKLSDEVLDKPASQSDVVDDPDVQSEPPVAEDDVKLSSEPIKLSDEGLDKQAGQSDGADNLAIKTAVAAVSAVYHNPDEPTVDDLQDDLTYENIVLSPQVSVQDTIEADVIVHSADSKENKDTSGDVSSPDKTNNKSLPSDVPASSSSGGSDNASPVAVGQSETRGDHEVTEEIEQQVDTLTSSEAPQEILATNESASVSSASSEDDVISVVAAVDVLEDASIIDDSQQASEEKEETIQQVTATLTSEIPPDEHSTLSEPSSDSKEPKNDVDHEVDDADTGKQASKSSSTPGEEEEMTDDDLAMSWAINYYSGRI